MAQQRWNHPAAKLRLIRAVRAVEVRAAHERDFDLASAMQLEHLLGDGDAGFAFAGGAVHRTVFADVVGVGLIVDVEVVADDELSLVLRCALGDVAPQQWQLRLPRFDAVFGCGAVVDHARASGGSFGAVNVIRVGFDHLDTRGDALHRAAAIDDAHGFLALEELGEDGASEWARTEDHVFHKVAPVVIGEICCEINVAVRLERAAVVDAAST